MKDKKLILFDFDGTITRNDSFLLFIKYYAGWFRLVAGFLVLSPILLLYKIRLIPNWKAKEIVLAYFFKGESLDIFSDKAKFFSLNILPRIIRSEAAHIIREYKNNGDIVVIVSASIDLWLKPWCDLNGLQLISSSLEVKDGRITGKILGANCYGPEKVMRIKEKFDLNTFKEIHAFGDSKGDREMMEVADKRHYRPF